MIPIRIQPDEPDNDTGQYVSLDQIGAMVQMTTKAMRRYVKQMPEPAHPGQGRRESLWVWADVRPWLVEEFQMPSLPAKYPEGRHCEKGLMLAYVDIEPDKIYPETELRRLGRVFSESSLRKGRDCGNLQYAEPSAGKRFYRGAWLLEWLSRPENPVK